MITVPTEFLVRRLNELGLHGEALYAELARFDAANMVQRVVEPTGHPAPETPDARKRRLAAERQRRHRDGQKAIVTDASAVPSPIPVTPACCACHATVTHCHATSSPSLSQTSSKEIKEEAKQRKSSVREACHASVTLGHAKSHAFKSSDDRNRRRAATFVPMLSFNPNWLPSEQDRFKAKEVGLTEVEINKEAASFRDYCLAKGVVSADWRATWRIWCRRAVEWPGRKPASMTQLTKPLRTQAWIRLDGPEWRAWTVHNGKPFPVDARGGWYVPTRWPPSNASEAA